MRPPIVVLLAAVGLTVGVTIAPAAGPPPDRAAPAAPPSAVAESARALVRAAHGALLQGDPGRVETLLERLRASRAGARAAGGSGELLHVEIRTIEGLLALQAAAPAQAVAAFEEVLRLRPTRTAAWLYLAQARYANGDPRSALTALQAGEQAGQGLPAYHLLSARCRRDLGQRGQAHAALTQGLRLFPDDVTLLTEEVGVLLELGLSAAALDVGRRLLAAGEASPYAALALSEALRRAGQLDGAAATLEEARLRFPGDTRLARQLAHVYAAAGLHGRAGRQLERLSWAQPALAFEAADQYRLAERWRAALRCNGRVPQQRLRTPQRAAILAGAGRADEALALLGGLVEQGWLDDTLRPALARAALQAARPELALDLLVGLRAAGARAGAVELRQAVDRCLAEPTACP